MADDKEVPVYEREPTVETLYDLMLANILAHDRKLGRNYGGS